MSTFKPRPNQYVGAGSSWGVYPSGSCLSRRSQLHPWMELNFIGARLARRAA